MITEVTIDTIEELTRNFAASRNLLTERLSDLNVEIREAKRRRWRGIKNALEKVKDDQTRLENAIADNPHLFQRPRTITIDGIRVGLQKGKGKIEWDDADKVIALIEKHLPDQADVLIKVTRSPARAALASLSVAELKKIGCRIEETADQVLIKAQESELEKLVNRIIEEGEDFDDGE